MIPSYLQDRTDFTALVTSLGGTVLDSGHYDETSTHLIISKQIKNIISQKFDQRCRHTMSK